MGCHCVCNEPRCHVPSRSLKRRSLQRFSAKMLLLRLLLRCSKLLPENESPRGRHNFFDLFLFRLTALNEMNSPESSKNLKFEKILPGLNGNRVPTSLSQGTLPVETAKIDDNEEYFPRQKNFESSSSAFSMTWTRKSKR